MVGKINKVVFKLPQYRLKQLKMNLHVRNVPWSYGGKSGLLKKPQPYQPKPIAVDLNRT